MNKDTKNLKECLTKEILLFDGAMGTMLQSLNLSENEYKGIHFKNHTELLKGNNDILSITCPQTVKNIHKSYLEAGSDVIRCNTFSANSVSQKKYKLENFVKEINLAAIKNAKDAVNEYKLENPEKQIFIAGVLGPTTISASISSDIQEPLKKEISFDELYNSYKEQTDIFAEQELDLIIIETIFDTLNAKAAIAAIKSSTKNKGIDIPIIISATLIDKSGRTLSGQTLEAFCYSLEYSNPIAFGLNCSMGIDKMRPYIESLNKTISCGVFVAANAGLPDELGQYNDSPQKMAKEYKNMAKAELLNFCGGCCGTTPEHIKEIYKSIKKYKPREIRNNYNNIHFCGLEALKPQKDSFTIIGQRTNISGSKEFAKLIKNQEFEKAIQFTKNEIQNGAKIIDINMDDETNHSVLNMDTFLKMCSNEPEISKIPIMVDSSNFEIIELALHNIQSKPIINSISLARGEEEFIKKALYIKENGGAIVVMACDERVQGITIDDRIKIIEKEYAILTDICGYNPFDIIFDLNIFPIATGIQEHDTNAINFLKALDILKKKYPKCSFSGGISNLSFSFRNNSYIRQAIHSIFVHHAQKTGMTFGIMNPKQLIPYGEINKDLKTHIEDLLFNKSPDAQIKLLKYIEKTTNSTPKTEIKEKNQTNLCNEIIAGNTENIYELLKELLKKHSKQEIVEKYLLESMTIVSEKFDNGEMFLPQVINSSRAIRKAINILKELLPQGEAKTNGTIVLATVKGDIHDIGKNIFALILECNNFKIIDLGVMVPAIDIIKAARKYNADIVALSGLVTSSLDEMQNVAKKFKSKGFKLPALMIGGATTSKKHTALKIAPFYDGLVVHTSNASQAAVAALKIMTNDKNYIEAIQNEQKSYLNIV